MRRTGVVAGTIVAADALTGGADAGSVSSSPAPSLMSTTLSRGSELTSGRSVVTDAVRACRPVREAGILEG